jgi:hypothetical protein
MSNLPLAELLAIEDPFERRLLFAALLQEALHAQGEETVVVGGHALEAYTMGQYTTGDIDLVVFAKQPAEALLQQWGFLRRGRIFWHEDLAVAVDLIADRLGGDWNRTEQLTIGSHQARLIAPEDLIIDRLNACVHWDIPEQCQWAGRVLKAERDRLDMDYLRQRAAEELVSAALDELLKEAEDD